MQERVGVVGAGLMGSEIALVFALAGHGVRLAARSPEQVSAALARLRGVLDKGIQRGFYEPAAADAALARITPSGIEEFGDRDFVTEAVFEDIAVKAEVLAALDYIETVARIRGWEVK